MKLAELLSEALVDKAPSKEDLDFSVAAIEKVIADLEEKTKDAAYKKRWGHTISYDVSRLKIAIELHEKFIPQFNEIKKKMDDAHKARDVDGMKEARRDLAKLLTDSKFMVLCNRATKRVGEIMKTVTPYRDKIAQMQRTVLAVRDGIDDEIKRAGRTDAQNERSDKQSAAMKRRWGMSESLVALAESEDAAVQAAAKAVFTMACDRAERANGEVDTDGVDDFLEVCAREFATKVLAAAKKMNED